MVEKVDKFFEASPSKCTAVRGRCGRLLNKVQTPAVTVVTQRGLPAYLSRDLLDSLPGTGVVQLPLGDMTAAKEVIVAANAWASQNQKENDNADNNSEEEVQKKIAPKKDIGVTEHFNLGEDRVSFLSFRNPRLVESVFGGESGLSLDAINGRTKMDVSKLIETQNVLKCDILVAPSEEAPIGQSGVQKTMRAVKKSGEFLTKLLAERDNAAFSAFVLANVQGGADQDQRVRALQDGVCHVPGGIA